MKKFKLSPLFPCKKEEYNKIIKNWQITFQASDLKDNYFLDLLNNKLYTIKSLYIKEDPWIIYFGHSNLLCARATRVITNHAPTGEYYLRLFPREDFSCPYRVYPIETKCYILYNCRKYNKYWNLLRSMLSQFVAFLEFNPNVFSFHEDIT